MWYGTLYKASLPVDWCHDYDQILGYLDTFEPGEDLTVSGALVHFTENDRASEIAHKANRKVPYEASIDWHPAVPGDVVLEFVPEGMNVAVNGREIAGPVTVLRKRPLRAVAICPHGADPNTNTQVAAADAPAVPLAVTLLSMESDMPRYLSPGTKSGGAATATQSDTASQPSGETASDDTAADTGDAGSDGGGGDDPAANPDDDGNAALSPDADVQLSGQQLAAWQAEFGAENAIGWLSEGIDLAEARKRHNEQLTAKLSAAQQASQDLQRRIDQAKTGSEQPLDDNEPSTAPATAGSDQPDNYTRAAAGIAARMNRAK